VTWGCGAERAAVGARVDQAWLLHAKHFLKGGQRDG